MRIVYSQLIPSIAFVLRGIYLLWKPQKSIKIFSRFVIPEEKVKDFSFAQSINSFELALLLVVMMTVEPFFTGDYEYLYLFIYILAAAIILMKCMLICKKYADYSI